MLIKESDTLKRNRYQKAAKIDGLASWHISTGNCEGLPRQLHSGMHAVVGAAHVSTSSSPTCSAWPAISPGACDPVRSATGTVCSRRMLQQKQRTDAFGQ